MSHSYEWDISLVAAVLAGWQACRPVTVAASQWDTSLPQSQKINPPGYKARRHPEEKTQKAQLRSNKNSRLHLFTLKDTVAAPMVAPTSAPTDETRT